MQRSVRSDIRKLTCFHHSMLTINGRQCGAVESVLGLGLLIARWLVPTHLTSLNICLLMCKRGMKHIIEKLLRSNVIHSVNKCSYFSETKFKVFHYLSE